jgi:phosphomannomutase
MVIRFGPAGWRGVIADEITIAMVRRLAAAVADHLGGTGRARGGVFVGHDTRFLAARFAGEAAVTLAAHGVPVWLAAAPLPTPAAAYAVASGRRSLGLVITGGHLAPEVSGVKVLGPDGGPAPDDILRSIEAAAAAAVTAGAATPNRRAGRPVRTLDIRAAYLRRLRSLAPPARVKRSRLKAACDPRYGAAVGWLDTAMAGAVRSLQVLNVPAHPSFGGELPDCGETHLRALGRAVRRGRLAIGAAVDGDGDRFGVVDQGGAWVPPNHVLALLADYLMADRRMTGGLVRSVATTHLLDAVASLHGRTVAETPVGFAHLALHLRAGSAFLACEENGGLALAAHLPQRDGILAALLVLEMIAARRRSLRDQVRDLFAKVGPRHGRRIDYHVDAAARERLLRRLEDPPDALGGRRVRQVGIVDGCKLILADGSWVLIRSAGTETAIRCYIETRAPRDLEILTGAARELITKG